MRATASTKKSSGAPVILPVNWVHTHAFLQRFAHLRRLRGQDRMYEVRRIIKAFVDAQWLKDFDERLAEYRRHLAGAEAEDDNG